MDHRHLHPVEDGAPTLAHIDDVIERGSFEDWLQLGRVVLTDPEVRSSTRTLAERGMMVSERPDRPHFWLTFCDEVTAQRAGYDR